MSFLFIILISLIFAISQILPIGSYIHLSILIDIFLFDYNIDVVIIVLQLALLVSLLITYKNDVVILLKNKFCKTNSLVVISLLTTLIFIMIFGSHCIINTSRTTIIYCLLFCVIILSIGDYLTQNPYIMHNNIYNIAHISLSKGYAMIVGVLIGVSLITPISSRATVIGSGLILGQDKYQTVKYSYLMSICVLFFNTCYNVITFNNWTNIDFSLFQLIVCFAICYFASIYAIKLFNYIIEYNYLCYISYYLIIIAFSIIFSFVI